MTKIVRTPHCNRCNSPSYKRKLRIIACTWWCRLCIKNITTHPALRKAS